MSDKKALLLRLLIILSSMNLVFLSSCGDNSQDKHAAQQKKDHVWKSQTDTIEKAKAVEGIIQDSADSQRQQIQEQTQ